MSKTTFVDGNPQQGIQGTIVTAGFLNAVNNHRHRGLAEDGDGALDYAVDSGTVNHFVIALTPALPAQIIGMQIHFKAANANTGAADLVVNGLAAVPIKKRYNVALQAGDILANQIVTVVYDGTNFQVISVLNAPDADTVDGFHASATPTANTLLPLDANVKVPLAVLRGLLVAEVLVGADVTSIQFTGLDGDAHGGYTLVATLINAAAVANLLRIYLNNDLTNANYYFRVIDTDGTTLSTGGGNDASLVNIAANKDLQLVLAINRHGVGYICGTKFEGNRQMSIKGVQTAAGISNITQIDVVGSAANGIGAGSKFRLYRRL